MQVVFFRHDIQVGEHVDSSGQTETINERKNKKHMTELTPNVTTLTLGRQNPKDLTDEICCCSNYILFPQIRTNTCQTLRLEKKNCCVLLIVDFTAEGE